MGKKYFLIVASGMEKNRIRVFKSEESIQIENWLAK
jgi:hypothetical protein